MKKSDLKNRMVVELRNGSFGIVIDDEIIGENGWCYVADYKDDLTFPEKIELDIMAVYKGLCRLDNLKNINNLILIWERKKVEKETLTQDQHDKLKALLTLGYNWVATDVGGVLFVYGQKPIKMNYVWINKGDYITLKNLELPFIKWEEDEPRRIEDLLKLEVK